MNPIMKKTILLAAFAVAAFALGACANKKKQAAYPEPAPSQQTTYDITK